MIITTLPYVLKKLLRPVLHLELGLNLFIARSYNLMYLGLIRGNFAVRNGLCLHELCDIR